MARGPSETTGATSLARVVDDETLKGWLEDAGKVSASTRKPRLTLPDRATRDRLAQELFWAARWLDYPHPKPHAIQEEPAPALKYGRLLLKHLPREIERVSSIAKKLENTPVADGAQEGALLLRNGEDTIRKMVEIMQAFDMRPVHRNFWHLCALAIFHAAQDAWEAGSGRRPQSPNAGDPLNRFVQLALAWFEGAAERNDETICDALRKEIASHR